MGAAVFEQAPSAVGSFAHRERGDSPFIEPAPPSPHSNRFDIPTADSFSGAPSFSRFGAPSFTVFAPM
jgi:hypothetical protein